MTTEPTSMAGCAQDADAQHATKRLDVARLLRHLDRPTMVYRFARARGDRHPGARRARENAEMEIKRVITLHLAGRADVLDEEQVARVECRTERANRRAFDVPRRGSRRTR